MVEYVDKISLVMALGAALFCLALYLNEHRGLLMAGATLMGFALGVGWELKKARPRKNG